LYAIARSRCYRVLRERTRLSSLDEGHDMSDDTIESPEAGSHRAELRELVRTAMDGLNPREREIIDLTLRHELSGPQLAAILGVSAKHAHALASTARAQLQRALGTVLVARTRGRDCPALREVLAGWDGRFSPLW